MTLRCTDLRLAFRDGDQTIAALDGVTLAVEPGELVAVTGPSGSGKSTLLAVAGLLRRPDEGTVEIAGHDATAARDRVRAALRRDHLAFVFQSASLFPSLTVVEQLELVAHVRGRLDGEARRRARELVDAVGLGGRAAHRPHQLSGGERQRAGIARALMSGPSVLCVDEPTASLDRQRSHEIMELLAHETRTRGTATLLVTHDLERLDLADRHLAMLDGRLTAAAAA